MRVHVVHIAPVCDCALFGKASCIDRRMKSPRVQIDQRIVLINEPHLISVALQRGRKDQLVNVSTGRALEIVEIDDGHRRSRISPNRPALHVNSEGWVAIQFKLVEASKSLAVR